MDFLKVVFGDKALTFQQFVDAVQANSNIKLANLADGKYVDKEKLTKTQEKLSDAENTIATLKKDSTDVETLRKTIADYETKEKDRADAEAAAQKIAALKARFAPLKKENTFLNEGTEQWIFGEFSKALDLEENKGKSDAEIYDAITKDKNIYQNPNQVLKSPQVKGSEGAAGDKAYMDKFYEGNPFYNK